MDHTADKIIKFDRENKLLHVQFGNERRVINLTRLMNNHPVLRGLAIVPVLERGGVRLGAVQLSGPTLYHMGTQRD
jgi:hypothetical protein